MGGVNNAKNYIDLMRFGYTINTEEDTNVPVITDSLLQGGIVASYYLGCLFGALFGGWMGDKVGRIKTIAFGAAWTIIGAALQTAAQNSDWMICCEKHPLHCVYGTLTEASSCCQWHWYRHFECHCTSLGYGDRRTYFTWPIHCYRIYAQYFWRRRRVLACIVSISIHGNKKSSLIICSYSGLVYVDGGVTAFRWRFPIAFQIIPLFILLILVWFFPESPRWLTKVGREDEAVYVLKRLRGDGSNPADAGKAQAEFEDIRNIAELEKTSAHSTSYWSMITGKGSGRLHTGRRVQLVIWLQIMQEWVGIAGVTICSFHPHTREMRATLTIS